MLFKHYNFENSNVAINEIIVYYNFFEIIIFNL